MFANLKKQIQKIDTTSTPKIIFQLFFKMACVARTRVGNQCTRPGNTFEGHCGTHHNSLYARDLEYRARYQAFVAAIPERRRQEDERRAARIAAEAAATAAAAAEQERRRVEQLRQETERRREAKRTENQQALDNAANFTPSQIINYARLLSNLWTVVPLQGYDAIRAYIALRHRPTKHEGFIELMRATIVVINQSRHPDHATYSDVPAAERQTALTALTVALTPYGEIRIEELPPRDAIVPQVQNRLRADAERAAAARREAERAARHAQLRHDLRTVPVVFQRDPEGSVDLAALARDQESVHRSSVQTTTQKGVLALMARPVREGQETLSEVVQVLNERRIVRFSSEGTRERAIAEVTNDYFNTEAFSTKYGDVLDRVWAFIHPHEEREQLIVRLAQEICDGMATCGNGKMARLVNVLQGYDDTLEFDVPRELFQNKFAQLRSRPVSERATAANEVFREFNIPEEERNVWLTPLMEEP